MVQDIGAYWWYNKCKGNSKNQPKTLHLEGFYVSLQQRADRSGRFQAASWHETEGKQPLGEKAQTISWLEIEKRYAALFTNRKGNVAKPLRLALGACIIQAKYGYSDEETALQIQEKPYLQYFYGKLSLGRSLTTRQMERLDTLRTIYEQQKYMHDNHTHRVSDRIVSVSQLFVRPIVRGKAGKPVEFGAKLDIRVVDGWTRLECCSFDAYNEAGNLQEMAERFREREGHYPSRILADKIYRNRENLSYCKKHGIRLSGPALGRPKKGETRDKT